MPATPPGAPTELYKDERVWYSESGDLPILATVLNGDAARGYTIQLPAPGKARPPTRHAGRAQLGTPMYLKFCDLHGPKGELICRVARRLMELLGKGVRRHNHSPHTHHTQAGRYATVMRPLRTRDEHEHAC